MKRFFLPAFMLMFGAALVSAQPAPQDPSPGTPEAPPPGPNADPPQFRRALTGIQGVLGFVNGRIAVIDGETTYYVRGLDRLFGFVDGLKEDAEVTLEGYVLNIPPAPEYKYFLAEKLVFNNKEYGGLLSGERTGRAFPGGPGFSPPGWMTHNRRQRPSPAYRHNDGKRRERR
jgi:hypothetical protein